ncbi:hypothetical protein, partial [Streptomyces sp. UNOC14_S4]|uniref:hypothetical protein n=1 Tax=Streptomyces sp. UNOC14_S4 TaxID=2872340 RepID=UPI001E29CA40
AEESEWGCGWAPADGDAAWYTDGERGGPMSVSGHEGLYLPPNAGAFAIRHFSYDSSLNQV